MRFFILLLIVFGLVHTANIYEFDVAIHENDTAEVIGFKLSTGEKSYFHSTEDNNYEIRIVSDSRELFSQGFEMHFHDGLFRGPNSTLPDTGPITTVTYYWRLPYFENASAIQLFHEEKLILEYPIVDSDEGPLAGLDPLICGLLCVSGFVIVAGLYLILAKSFGKNGGGR